MHPEDRDAALLWDMREAAREIQEFTQGITYARFASDKMRRYAVERQIMVIGEAARQVSEGFKTAHPEIPWKGIIGQRNVLAHEYGEVLVERIWLVAIRDIPDLLRSLEQLVPLVDDLDDR